MTNKQRARKHKMVVQIVERAWTLIGDHVVAVQDTPAGAGVEEAFDAMNHEGEAALLAAFLRNTQKFAEGVCEDLAYPAEDFFASLYWKQRVIEMQPKAAR